MIQNSNHKLITMRIIHPNTTQSLTDIIQIINQVECQVGAIDIVKFKDNLATRDISVTTSSDHQVKQLLRSLEALDKVKVIDWSDPTFLLHLGGKLEVKSKTPIRNREHLSHVYTPGVARVCMAIAEHPEKAHKLTIRRNTVAIVSDGSAVLGLGNIGALGALPVMEGKAALLKEFANVDGFPICVYTQDTEEIIHITKQISANFGAINLEDISAPRCFEIEKRLRQECDIPVFHDDQHGTAAVMTAALINALKLTRKKAKKIKVVINGVGAAGTACAKMMLTLGVKNIIGCDRKGVICKQRDDLNDAKKDFCSYTNPKNITGSLYDALQNADVFVGLSAPDILKQEHLKTMAKDPIVFAMANPTPEIMPEEAAGHVAIMATGRSDYPNQINNLLAFPGIFRGALDCRARDINDEMKLASAYAIANIIPEDELSPDYIIPSVFNNNVSAAVAEAVIEAAIKTGVADKE